MKRTKKARKMRSGGRGSILLIVMLLLGSAALRVTTGAGEAIAKGAEAQHETLVAQHTGQDGVPEDQLTETGHDQAASPSEPPALDRTQTASLLEALRERETKVALREKQIEMRTKALSVADEEIQKRLVSLEQAEIALRKTLALAQTAAEDDLARLTAVYENMKPKDAAAVFEAMEPDFAAGFLARMRPDAAAAVMTGLPPEKAYSISVILAGRNANAPKS